MTNADLKNLLANDPGFGIGIILSNNPEDVVENLHAAGYKVTSADDCWAAIKDLIRRGETRLLKQVLSVEFRADRADPELAAAIGQVAGGMQTKSGNGNDISATDIFGGLATGILYTLQSSQGNLNRPNQGTNPNTQPPKKDNTTMWIVVAVAVVVLILLIILIARRRK